MSKPPTLWDFWERGFNVIVFGPFIALFTLVALPFVLVGLLTHRWWPVEHDEPAPGEW
jgi:hypothetical protein